MKIKIERYKKFPEGKIKGIAQIALDIDGHYLTIKDVKVIDNSKGGVFYALPSRKYTSPEGEEKYTPICAFFSKESYHIFHETMTASFKEFFQNEANESVHKSTEETAPF